MTGLWTAVLVGCIGCYLLKLAGVSLPETALNHPRVQRTAALLPVTMLAALVASQVFDDGTGAWRADPALLAGMGFALGALILRQGFLVVFLGSVVVTALVRLLL